MFLCDRPDLRVKFLNSLRSLRTSSPSSPVAKRHGSACSSRTQAKQFACFGTRKIKTHLSVVFTYALPTGLEPATSRVTGECSNQLSYGRIMLMAGIKSIILDFRFRTQAKQFACVPPPCVGGRNRSQVLFRKPATPPHCRQWRHVPAFDSSRKQSSLLACLHLVSAAGIEPATLGL